jgi:hypothetical protein
MPEYPALSREKNSHSPPVAMRKNKNNLKELRKGRGVPSHMKHGSNPTPHKASKTTGKENIISSFNLTAHHTKPISWTMPMVNLFTARKMVNSKLPSKDLNFLGEFSLRDNLW